MIITFNLRKTGKIIRNDDKLSLVVAINDIHYIIVAISDSFQREKLVEKKRVRVIISQIESYQ